MHNLLKVNGLTTTLPNGAAVVDGISFSLDKGKTLALLGESGCGKSMTALSLLRLLPDGVRNSRGQVVLSGVDLFALTEAQMCGVRGGQAAMIFQEPGLSLNPVLTVGQQIREVLALHQPQHNNEAYCVELLQRVGIPDAAQRVKVYPFQLSGGMKQRVMIAMALAGAPNLLIADEPTTALDVTMQAQVLALLREQQQLTGMAILLITHDLGVVSENADFVAVMYAGQIIEYGSRAQLFSQPRHPYTQKLFAALPEGKRAQGLTAIVGRVPSPGSIQSGCRFVERCDRAEARCRHETPEMIDLNGQQVACLLYQYSDTLPQQIQLEATATQRTADKNDEPILAVQNLQVHFPIRKGILQRTVGHVKAVDGVNLSLRAGRTLALVGESGCGKTTLGKALLNLVPPSAGQIRFHQSAWFVDKAPSKDWGRGMQMVFQDPYASLNPRMRVSEIIEEGLLALKQGGDQAARAALIDALLQQVGLPAESKWRYPHEFSGGQRQRIAIARALAVSPQVLICDEPTSALDVSVQAQILNLLRALQAELELAYLFITHNISVVEYLADEVCVMYLGRVVESGSVTQVLTRPQHPYTQALLSAVPSVAERSVVPIKLSGELPSPANPPKGCHFAPRCPVADANCQVSYPESRACDEGHYVACFKVQS